ncbi:hypothetical protein ACX0G9_16375, partial [Flavitalea flava]
MDKLIKPGRIFFSIALIVFGIQNFIVGDFVAGRAPAWPADVPGKLLWAYLSGSILVIAGLAILLEKKPRLAGLLVGIMIFLWAGLRNLVLAGSNLTNGGIWVNAGKGLALTGGAFIVAGLYSSVQENHFSKLLVNSRVMNKLLPVSQIFVGLFLFICGIVHFQYPDLVATLVPAWIPGHLFWAYFAGVLLIGGGLCLIFRIKESLVAFLSGLMIFLWVF